MLQTNLRFSASRIDGVAPGARVDVHKACWYAAKNTNKALRSSWTLAKALDATFKSGGRVINLSPGSPEDALLSPLTWT